MTSKFLFTVFIFAVISSEKLVAQTALTSKIDSFLKTQTKRPFNGIILIAKNGKLLYSKVQGYANLETKKPLVLDNQFVVGSISKQMTAVAVLREFEKRKIELHVPVRKYLPEMPQTWLDSITVHQLLNHTSGVMDWNKPLKFKPSTDFSYSNVGYELLAKIAEKVSRKSYAVLMSEIFKTCGIKNSMSPALNQHKQLVNSYVEDSTGKVKRVEGLLLDLGIPSGGMISTAKDLLLWNKNLHGGKLLSKKSYDLMTTASSSRDHFIFGKVDYGYGLQIDRKGKTLEIGHSGYATGFASANFYYPETKTNLIILENIAWDADNFKDTFKHHVEIRKILGGGK